MQQAKFVPWHLVEEDYRAQFANSGMGAPAKESRIVSISQPHVRPILRGKASQRVEFGAKTSASHVDGFILLDRYFMGCLQRNLRPRRASREVPGALRALPGRHSRRQDLSERRQPCVCKERGIRLSGKPLGRPKGLSREEKKQHRQDEKDRIPIEGKFGNSIRKGTL